MSHYLRLAFMLLLWSAHKVQSGAKFTNIVCEVVDKDFLNIPYCYIKAVNRTYQYLSVKVGLLQKPLTNFSVTFAVQKKANGYKPFLYNYTVDGCKFLKGSIGNPVLKFFFKGVGPYTNLNHTCPYNHDIVTEKVSIYNVNYLFTNVLPLPRGDYGFFYIFHACNIPRLLIKAYVQFY